MKNLPTNAEAAGDVNSISGLERSPGPWRTEWQPILVFLSGKSHGRRSPAGYSPWGRKESDTTEHLNSSSTTPPPTSATHKSMRTDLRPLEPLCPQALEQELPESLHHPPLPLNPTALNQ